jgi:hypothetical protein
MSIKSRVLNMDLVDWFIAIIVVGFISAGIAESIDWIDRRSCRTSGGSVQIDEDHSEWQCIGRRVRP